MITPNYSEPIVYTGLADGSIRIYSINQGSNPMSQIKGLIDFPISSITLSSSNSPLTQTETKSLWAAKRVHR